MDSAIFEFRRDAFFSDGIFGSARHIEISGVKVGVGCRFNGGIRLISLALDGLIKPTGLISPINRKRHPRDQYQKDDHDQKKIRIQQFFEFIHHF